MEIKIHNDGNYIRLISDDEGFNYDPPQIICNVNDQDSNEKIIESCIQSHQWRIRNLEEAIKALRKQKIKATKAMSA